MQIIPIDLKKNPEVADLLTDMQPGARVYLCATIKDKDLANANLRIEEIVAKPEDLPQPGEKYGDEEDGEITKDTEGGAEAEGAGREQMDSPMPPMDSMGQAGPGGG